MAANGGRGLEGEKREENGKIYGGKESHERMRKKKMLTRSSALMSREENNGRGRQIKKSETKNEKYLGRARESGGLSAL